MTENIKVNEMSGKRDHIMGFLCILIAVIKRNISVLTKENLILICDIFDIGEELYVITELNEFEKIITDEDFCRYMVSEFERILQKSQTKRIKEQNGEKYEKNNGDLNSNHPVRN